MEDSALTPKNVQFIQTTTKAKIKGSNVLFTFLIFTEVLNDLLKFLNNICGRSRMKPSWWFYKRVFALKNSSFSFCIILVPPSLWSNQILCCSFPASGPLVTLRFNKMVKSMIADSVRAGSENCLTISREEQSTCHVQHLPSLLQICSHALVFHCLKRWASAARKLCCYFGIS